MSRRDKGRLPDFVSVVKSTIDTPAWRALSHGARSLYIALRRRYHTKLQGAVYLSTRAAVKELGSHSHRDNVRRWFRELDYYRFIRMVSPGCLGVEGRGKAPHWRLTESPYLGDKPTRDFDHWDGVPFREQKRAARYVAKKQNPGPCVRSTVNHPFRPVVDHPSGPHLTETGPPAQAIQQPPPGPPDQAITSLTTPSAEAGAAKALSGADVDLLEIPSFLRRGHPDCGFP
jgi:hypothetical protein